MKKKVKKVSKYLMNILAMINALLIGLSPIWGWNLDKLTDSIVVINGIIGLWLVGGKIFTTPEVENEK
jgi:uncharacterized membrane protein